MTPNSTVDSQSELVMRCYNEELTKNVSACLFIAKVQTRAHMHVTETKHA